MATSSVYQQEGASPSDDYFDIMLVGKTGLGKTTTADKLLLANPTGRIYTYNPPEPDESSAVHQASDAPVQHYEDFSMWHISDEASDIEQVETRLKNLAFCRSVEDPHKEVNKLRKESGVTRYCELLSNESSKVRVLDVPGFFGSEINITNTDLLGRAEAVASRNLQIMRKILHIKEVYNFKFNRIIYFLPETGVLTRHSQILQMEIETMETYFGPSIFYCMVVAATHPARAYRNFRDDTELYCEEDYTETQHHFQQAMSMVFGKSSDIPKPPIVFVSYLETCDGILELVRTAKVAQEGVVLSFNSRKCARCDVTIKKVKGKFKEENESELKISKDVPVSTKAVYTCTNSAWSNELPYNETTCHPMIIPKYTTLKRVAGGIAHLITLYRFKGRWPSFKSFEEICIACKGSPGTRGCKQVGATYFLHKKCKQCMNCKKCERCSDECKMSEEWTECSKCKTCETCEMCKKCKDCITIDHTSSVSENYIIQDEDRPEE